MYTMSPAILSICLLHVILSMAGAASASYNPAQRLLAEQGQGNQHGAKVMFVKLEESCYKRYPDQLQKIASEFQTARNIARLASESFGRQPQQPGLPKPPGMTGFYSQAFMPDLKSWGNNADENAVNDYLREYFARIERATLLQERDEHGENIRQLHIDCDPDQMKPTNPPKPVCDGEVVASTKPVAHHITLCPPFFKLPDTKDVKCVKGKALEDYNCKGQLILGSAVVDSYLLVKMEMICDPHAYHQCHILARALVHELSHLELNYFRPEQLDFTKKGLPPYTM